MSGLICSLGESNILSAIQANAVGWVCALVTTPMNPSIGDTYTTYAGSFANNTNFPGYVAGKTLTKWTVYPPQIDTYGGAYMVHPPLHWTASGNPPSTLTLYGFVIYNPNTNSSLGGVNRLICASAFGNTVIPGSGCTVIITVIAGVIQPNVVVLASGISYPTNTTISLAITGGGGTGGTVTATTGDLGQVVSLKLVTGGTGYSNTIGAATTPVQQVVQSTNIVTVSGFTLIAFDETLCNNP